MPHPSERFDYRVRRRTFARGGGRRDLSAPAMTRRASDGIQTAVIAGGCFWGVQGVFQHTAGVVICGVRLCRRQQGDREYTVVSTGATGHAEAVEIKYDPKKISYGKILQIFFSVAHDPTSSTPGSGLGHAVSLGDLYRQ